MNSRVAVRLGLAIGVGLLLAACGAPGDSSNTDKTIKSTTSNGLTITLSSDTGQVKGGKNDLILLFADSSGKPVDVGAASLNFHMPAMGSMAEMTETSTLTTTTTPGRYRAQVNLESGGTWEARISYQGSKGTGQSTMSVSAR
ncbi:MAG TPA: FixH family protein [Blastocatellia bacterium]|nr:FixH family protein [Blastocatellia bacterium]